jgi:hypothetical protein
MRFLIEIPVRDVPSTLRDETRALVDSLIADKIASLVVGPDSLLYKVECTYEEGWAFAKTMNDRGYGCAVNVIQSLKAYDWSEQYVHNLIIEAENARYFLESELLRQEHPDWDEETRRQFILKRDEERQKRDAEDAGAAQVEKTEVAA